jgi:hypothetical protein
MRWFFRLSNGDKVDGEMVWSSQEDIRDAHRALSPGTRQGKKERHCYFTLKHLKEYKLHCMGI